MKKIKTNLSLQTKILCVTIVLFVVFCSISNILWYESLTDQAVHTAVSNVQSMMEIANTSFEKTLQDINNITALVCSNVDTEMKQEVVNWLTTMGEEGQENVQARRAVQTHLNNLCSFKSYLHGMTIYDFSGRSISFNAATPAKEVLAENWIPSLQNGEVDTLFIAPHPYAQNRAASRSNEVFSIVRSIRVNGKTIGFVQANIKRSLMDDMYDITDFQGYTIAVLDHENRDVIYQPEQGGGVPIEELIEGENLDQDWFFKEINRKDYLMICGKPSRITPWRVMGVVEKTEMMSSFSAVRNRVFGMVLCCAGVFIVLILLTTKQITKNLVVLTEAVSNMHPDDMKLDVDIVSNDEGGSLQFQIQKMLERIRMLVQEIRQKEKEKRTSEIQMLRSQINPHFLYNTLNTIKSLAYLQGIENIQSVSNALLDMLHLNLDKRTYISIAEEKAYLQQYITIQEYRYVDKFSYRIDVDEEVEDYLIPKCIVQPIVENALQHGIAPLKDRQGMLWIKCYQETDHLKIVVRDNGVGYQNHLEDTQDTEHRRHTSHHIGMANIESRLRLLFEDAGDMQITSELGLFTTVEITIPLIRPGEEIKYE